MSTSNKNVFAITSIFDQPNREISLPCKHIKHHPNALGLTDPPTQDSITITEQDLLDAYMNITYPSLERYANFYNFDIRFIKEVHKDFEHLTNVHRKSLQWQTKLYIVKDYAKEYNNIIISDFDIIIKSYGDVLKYTDKLGLITKSNIEGRYKKPIKILNELLGKKVDQFYKMSMFYLPQKFKDIFATELSSNEYKDILNDTQTHVNNDEIIANYIIQKHELPVFPINKVIKFLHYGGDDLKAKIIQLNDEYFKFKKYFSYI